MSHQPYKSWLLSEEPLDQENQQALQSHLETCDSCRALSTALHKVDDTFAQSPAPAPKPGFTKRWQTRLVISRQERQQRKMWLLTIGLFSTAGLIILAMLWLNIGSINWIFEISQVFANFSVFVSKINRFFNTMESLVRAFPILLPILIVFGIGSLSLFAALIVTWFSSMLKLYKSPKEGVLVR